MSSELNTFINKFLDRYNPSRSLDMAIKNALNAALQHNKLYSPNLPTNTRNEIKALWSDQLQKISGLYKTQRSLSEYEKDIVELQKEMNKKYAQYFRSDHKGGNGFRISHSQKSISIYLKYLWCLKLIEIPPCCPVDSIVLKLTDAEDKTWTFVNDIETHRNKFSYIEAKAKKTNLSVAEWEIRNFEA